MTSYHTIAKRQIRDEYLIQPLDLVMYAIKAICISFSVHIFIFLQSIMKDDVTFIDFTDGCFMRHI